VRRRYLALRLDCEEPPERSEVSDAVWNAVLRLFGEVGASQTGLYLVKYDEKKRYAVLRCAHNALPLVRAAVASITRIGNAPVAVHVMRVSGTLKALSRKTANTS